MISVRRDCRSCDIEVVLPDDPGIRWICIRIRVCGRFLAPRQIILLLLYLGTQEIGQCGGTQGSEYRTSVETSDCQHGVHIEAEDLVDFVLQSITK